ncbi:hypothetical protein [Bifidobacterium sp.]|uniref:hypothetical protein n=1 Tax=Bifidobacterium sp. TaxID=41200 RepID=UPI0039E8D09A
MTDYLTYAQDQIVCPYCHDRETDSNERQADSDIIYCDYCEKPFQYIRDVSVCYTTREITANDIARRQTWTPHTLRCFKCATRHGEYVTACCGQYLCRVCAPIKSACCDDYTQITKQLTEDREDQ